ncbi:hypothetical protein GF325_11295, partial [Candidatus Bathyarchaeota archaeon]|nr:hypothetical protein [Candidatus Bathyarchaeota archaeon]
MNAGEDVKSPKSQSEPCDAPEPRKEPEPLLIALVGVYSATTVGAAYAFTLIPNVEFLSVLVFLGGMIFGHFIGMLNGLVSATMYFVFNVNGMSPAPLLALQVLLYTTLGLLGGMIRKTNLRRVLTIKVQIIYGCMGAGFAFFYTLLIDTTWALVFGINVWVWYLQGIV